MPKKDCDPFDHLEKATRLIANPGALLVTQDAADKPNVMAIAWCHIGFVWGLPVCIVYVRTSRHSYTCLEQLRQFTVNIPTAEMKRAIGITGSVSGRDQDKFAAADLTPVPSRCVKPPIIDQCIMHYECKVIHYNDLLPANMDRAVEQDSYAGTDYHRCYFGQIVATYVDPDALAKL
jgi:flavin reductase (DIM6/NTAB) family NADH-FMN oxidoreductase RutF